MSVFRGHPEIMVFIDETGSDRRDCMRPFSYSLRGRSAVCQKLLIQGEHVSAIAAMSCDGLLDLCTVTGSVDAEKFSWRNIYYLSCSLSLEQMPGVWLFWTMLPFTTLMELLNSYNPEAHWYSFYHHTVRILCLLKNYSLRSNPS